jgi:hypothetical protein
MGLYGKLKSGEAYMAAVGGTDAHQRPMKAIPRLVWVVPTILLIVATSELSDGYHTFTRIVTCGIAAVIAVGGFRDRPVSQWSVPLALVAVLFNPFIPIRLSPQTWSYLDIGAAALFAAHLTFVRSAPLTVRVRRIFWVLAFVALAVLVCCGSLFLLVFVVTMTKPGRWTAQDVQFLPWWLGAGILFVGGGGVFIHHLFKNPIRDTSPPDGESNAAKVQKRRSTTKWWIWSRQL